jgi:tRNA-splicing ligase RtcB (3'-phosphate/5'-hydroxy nucleic acid ligase)
MIKVIDSEKIPIKMWLNDIEPEALQQAKNLANLPFAFKWIALMPDSHSGYGMPIGGVMATRNIVVPNAVGVDIGCGMCAVRTNIHVEDLVDDVDIVKKIMNTVRSTVPVGFNHQQDDQQWSGFDTCPDNIPIIKQELKSSKKQLGTLGGGNHFIEFQKGSDGFIWIMIHSGSRNLGLKIAKDYHEKALLLCKRWHSNINNDLAFLPMETDEAKEYMIAMKFALDFAKENRYQMIERIKAAFNKHVKLVDFDDIINIHHNYAAWEHHFGENVIVHRKGATSAKKGEVGIIPGSQGTKSYITIGKGNPESFMSCSHGAGRKLGRKAAQRELNLEEEQKKLNDQGVIHSIRNIADLDEASGAYKDISVVMNNQSDLIDIVVELSPLAVIKA